MLNLPGGRLVGHSFASVLSAASQACADQDYPLGTLYVVASPIGNLADITLRALHLLQLVDLIACENSRHTQTLLRAYGIDKSQKQLLSVHQHNEVQAVAPIVQQLQQGQRVAYLSDAGTPAISDPGARLVSSVQRAGIKVVPLPGASSVPTLLSAAGIVTNNDEQKGFVFVGFLPTKAAERTQAVLNLTNETRAVVLLEAPHRIQALAKALATLGDRGLSVGRELTKQFEQITALAANQFVHWLNIDANHSKGEFTLVLHPTNAAPSIAPNERLLRVLLTELPLKTAVKLATEISGSSRKALYQLALSIKTSHNPPEP